MYCCISLTAKLEVRLDKEYTDGRASHPARKHVV
jgi:hypothetical protein